jgi:ATP-dependent RNA helicase DDX49/DBP8
MGVKTALIIGGNSIIEQGLKLSTRPHIIVATPGRMRHHLQSADPPRLDKAKFLVLDEADRLLTHGFSSELEVLVSSMSSKRQTLIFSATMNSSLEEIEKVTSNDTLRFDLTKQQKIPSNLQQEYLFIPGRVKLAYLMAFLSKVFNTELMRTQTGDKKKMNKKSKRLKSDDANIELLLSEKEPINSSSVIIFVGSCERCQEVHEILSQLKFDSVALHSLMSQNRRVAALGKFKSLACNILVATDVASRGLDIPTVDIVINYDIPKVVTDYIHRVGRTSRAGRSGRSVSLITQYDIDIVHAIEDYCTTKMVKATDISDKDVVPILNMVSKATRMARLRLSEIGFDEKLIEKAKRKRAEKKQKQKKQKMISKDS